MRLGRRSGARNLLLAWRKLDQYRGDARFATWLYRIAYTNF